MPTEAEWESAARNGEDATDFLWGDEPPTCALANVRDEKRGAGCGGDDTKSVCATPAGNTQLGLCDMAGNVWKWVEDDFRAGYDHAPADGSAWVDKPDRAGFRVIRAGSWFTVPVGVRAAFRGRDPPGLRDDSVGSRLSTSCPSGVSPSDCLQNNK